MAERDRLAGVDDPAEALDAIVAALAAEPVPPDEVVARAPAVAGLYAWWAPPAVLPMLEGPPHPRLPDLRLLYVGIATRLRSRLASNHLRDEIRLTTWMTTHLRVSWCAHPAPREVGATIIRTLRPPLNVDHATGPNVDVVKAARRRYYASAGARTA